tara:strand:+ start:2285 stop:2485 length:201 start_codon:yes stop_codon:yes gene_type:complete
MNLYNLIITTYIYIEGERIKKETKPISVPMTRNLCIKTGKKIKKRNKNSKLTYRCKKVSNIDIFDF